TITGRSTSNAEDWITSWNNPPAEQARNTNDRNRSTISFNNSSREQDLVPLQPNVKADDSNRYRAEDRAASSWSNDRSAQRQDPPTITSAPANPVPNNSKSSPFTFGSNAPPTQPTLGQPSQNQTGPSQPAIQPAPAANTTVAGYSQTVPQQTAGQPIANS